MLSKNPERILRKKKPIELSLKEADFDKRQKESLTNPTPEMERILGEMEALEKLREQMRDLDQLQDFNKQRTTWLKERWQSLEEAEVRIKIAISTPFSTLFSTPVLLLVHIYCYQYICMFIRTPILSLVHLHTSYYS